ncbi:MAG TPA: NAD(P)/FAD-dependent oxidoreductase [Vicinamibacteria bacterium]|nr:NAD(P)/FAD-dependent oxidoreductase [Vicinamibacteria bacterium]
MRVAIVGGGPAGCLLAWALARGGIEAVVFDASHPREKPCGGGLTPGAVRLLPPEPADDPLPARRVDRCRFESGEGAAVEVPLREPVRVASRQELDAWLLRRAREAGARHRAERVVAVDAEGGLRVAGGEREAFDLVVGADGAGSLVRRTLLGATPQSRLLMAGGWLAAGEAPMLVRFTPGLPGYLWVFPRPDHVEVGICAPLGLVPTRDLLARLDSEAARSFPQLAPPSRSRQAHTIPCPTSDPASILEIAGPRWALVGDAAALADPVTGEGIRYALRSALLLAESLLSESSARAYPRRVLEDFGRQLLRAARLRRLFFARGFARRMVRYSARSAGVRDTLAELVIGEQAYVGLGRRLLRALPRLLLDSLRTAARQA